MQQFHNYEQLTELIESIKTKPADDDRVTYNPFDETLEIRFNNVTGKKTTDSEGKEREVYERLLLRNVQNFDVETPDNGQPHRLEKVEQVDATTLRFVLTVARWVVKISGEPTGEFSEQVDDTDFEVGVSMGSLIGGAVAIAAIIGVLLWVF